MAVERVGDETPKNRSWKPKYQAERSLSAAEKQREVLVTE
jgi:hypothetical protein